MADKVDEFVNRLKAESTFVNWKILEIPQVQNENIGKEFSILDKFLFDIVNTFLLH